MDGIHGTHGSNARQPRGTRNLLLGLLLAWFVASCWMTLPEESGPQHGWWAERGPVVPHASFPMDCSACHVEGTWHELKPEFTFDHAAETGYPLEGGHARAQCLRCHNDRGPVQEFLVRGCAGCHEDRHLGRMGSDCEACHTQEDWEVRDAIARHDRTRFPLVGAHASAACWSCHPSADQGIFDRAPTSCSACHQDDLAAATEPDHQSQGWVADCQRCHVPTAWRPSSFDHNFFPLTGSHRAARCNTCHVSGFDTPLPTHCAGCHQADYDATDDPNHAAAGFPNSCEQCHDTVAWENAFFSHSGITSGCVNCHLSDYQGADDPDHVGKGFSTNCEQCHDTNDWDGARFSHVGIASGCVDCHLADYQGTTDPDHVDQGFATTCEQCHVTSVWNGAFFDHAGITSGCVDCHLADFQGTTDPNHAAQGFPTTCEQCHGTVSWDSGLFSHVGITSGCVDCHMPQYQGATNPNHAANGIPTTCEQCHNTNTWLGALFDHTGILSGCVNCHLADYNGATSPNHAANGLPTSCEQCHNARSWAGATFDHTGILSGCVNCHLADYNGASNPNHVSLGISTSCENCHGTNTWLGANFDHTGITTGCVNCHLSDYQGTSDPNHAGAGFPTTCQTCHNTNTWNGASFSHKFPLVGVHDVSCSECHQLPTNYAIFTCTDCHTQGDAADDHSRVDNYVWESNACYACHPDGQKD